MQDINRPGADWPNWRGPHYNGSTRAKGLPSAFSPKEKVRRVAPLPGPSADARLAGTDGVA